MANRKRHTVIPEEFQTDERLYTKKEMKEMMKLEVACPKCPVKAKSSVRDVYVQPQPLFFEKPVELSKLYNPEIKVPYLDQVYVRYGLIGEGCFGQVYKVRSKEDDTLYAVKRMKASVGKNDRLAEVRNNEKVGVNPYCVQYFMAWQESRELFIKLEYCDMSLSHLANNNHDIPEPMLWNVLFDIAQALHFLHERNFIHLDVKPDNIMMKQGYFKLADFGLLVDLNTSAVVAKSTLSDGDCKYLALEVLEGKYTPACDIFGLGISILELAADLVLPEQGPLWQQLRHNILPKFFYEKVSLGIQVMVEKMLAAEYATRPTAKAILKFPTVHNVMKHDRIHGRTNYGVEYLVENNKIDTLPLFNYEEEPVAAAAAATSSTSISSDSSSTEEGRSVPNILRRINLNYHRLQPMETEERGMPTSSTPMIPHSRVAFPSESILMDMEPFPLESGVNAPAAQSGDTDSGIQMTPARSYCYIQHKNLPKAKLNFD